MAGRGSENRQKARSVLVRLTADEYDRLTERAEREGASRAEYLRRRMADPAASAGPEDGTARLLTEADRAMLAAATRSMGHLAGLMKLAVLKTPGLGASRSVHSILNEHHRDLQDLQGQIREVLERMK